MNPHLFLQLMADIQAKPATEILLEFIPALIKTLPTEIALAELNSQFEGYNTVLIGYISV